MPPAGLEIRGPAAALADEPLALSARGAGDAAGALTWRARLRDDDSRVWRAVAARPEDLDGAWAPAKATTGPVAALASLRPLRLDVRVEAPDGRAAARTLERRLVAPGVRVRRWRSPITGTLCLPEPGVRPCGAVLVDATADEAAAHAGLLAGALLAGRDAVALVVTGAGRGGAGDALAAAREVLAAVPQAPGEPVVVEAPLPPGIPTTADVAERAAAWDALLARLGARPRTG